MLTRLISKLTPILFAIFAHVPDRDDRRQGILSLRRHGWVEPCRGVNIKTGVGWQSQVADNALEVLAVIVRKEKSMRAEGFIRLIHSPEKTDHGTGESLAR